MTCSDSARFSIMWFGLVALNRLGSVWRVGFPPHVCFSAHLDLKPGAMAPVPKHFLGDASSCRARAVYNGHQVETQSLLSDQASVKGRLGCVERLGGDFNGLRVVMHGTGFGD